MTHPYDMTGFEAVLHQRKSFLIDDTNKSDSDYEMEQVESIQLNLPLLSARGVCKGVMTTRQFHLVEVGGNTLVCLRRENVGREQICLELKIEANAVSNSSRLRLRYWSATGLMMALWIRRQVKQFERAMNCDQANEQLPSANRFTSEDGSAVKTGYECDAPNHLFAPLNVVRCYPG